MPKTILPSLLCARSRSVAKSGIKPTYQKTRDTVKYVVTAKTSQASGLRKFGHMPATLGNGYSQYANHGRPMCRIGNMPAHMTAKSVIASEKRLMLVRHF